MALPRKKKKDSGPTANALAPYPQQSLTVDAANSLAGPALDAVGGAVAKGANLLAEGGGALGGLAKSALQAARAVPLDSAVDVVTNAAGEAAKAAGPAASAMLGAAGDVLSNAAELAGPALGVAGDVAGDVLGAAGDVAGEVLGAVVEGIGDALS